MNEQVIEILTEEPSMENFLRGILPHVLPEDYQVDVNCFIRPHEGKSDLRKSIPKKFKAYPNFGYPVKVLIIHDQDSNDCVQLKSDLLSLCESASNIPVVVRIACKELENWYLGDMQAIEIVYPASKATSLINKAKYRNPDNLFGAHELGQMTPNFSKTHASREIPKHMAIKNNKSNSFNHFLSGLDKLISQNSTNIKPPL
jgi:hypothetical protein